MAQVSYKDIAAQAGVSQMTVSLALRNSSRLPAPTRKKIQELAAALGYRRDPQVVSLLDYMRDRRTRRTVPVIGYLDAGADSSLRSRSLFLHELHAGACTRAEELGYRVESFFIGDPNCRLERIDAVLHARGIRGLILPALPVGQPTLPLRWEHFSTVGVSLNTDALGHHLVASNFRQMMELAWTRLTDRGYQRIGLVIDRDFEARSHGDLSAHFLRLQRTVAGRDLPELLVAPQLTAENLHRWFRAEKPDAIVSLNSVVSLLLRRSGVAVPDEVGLAHLAASVSCPTGVSGVDRRPHLLGSIAIEQLARQLQLNEYGIPRNQFITLVEGVWVEGRSLRSASPTTSTARLEVRRARRKGSMRQS